MEIIVREHGAEFEAVCVYLDESDKIGPREFALKLAPQLAEQYQLIPRSLIPGEPFWFHWDDGYNCLFGLRKKVKDMSKKHSQEQEIEKTPEVATAPEDNGTATPTEQPAVDPAPEVPTEQPAIPEAGPATRASFQCLDPEDANTARQSWEKGPLPDQFIQDMKTKYQVEGNVGLGVTPEGAVTFVSLA